MPALPEAHLQFEKDLYDDDADEVVEWIRQLDPSQSRMMIVGHNPTLLDLCVMLADPVYVDELESAGLPTAALVRLDDPVAGGSNSWRDLTPGLARVGHRFVP
jgi:phosphohistidine phosphatase SixA